MNQSEEPDEWRSAQQITSFFSRLSAIRRQKQTDQGQYEEANEEIQEEDLEAVECEIAIDGLRRAVIRDMTVPRHPIEVGKRNVCELSRAKKLHALKVAELKESCESLQVGPPTRKKSFIGPLETYVKTCSCFKT